MGRKSLSHRNCYRAKISIAFVIKIYYGISIAVTNRSLDRSLFIRLVSVDLIQSLDSIESRQGACSYSTTIVTIFKHQIVSKYAKI